MKMQKLYKTFTFVVAMLFSCTLVAEDDPRQMLKSVAESTLISIKRDKDKIKEDPQILYRILESKVIPHVDFNEMSLWIAGKAAWRRASDSQRAEFIKEFKTLVLRTYSHFLLGVSDEEISFKSGNKGNGKRIQISGTIQRSNGEIIDIDYRLINSGGQWRIYDIVVQGVSLLKGFQAQFSEKIRHKGLSVVIAEIESHNAQK